MDLAAPIRRFDRFQQRHRGLAIVFAVIKKSSDDSAGNLAALVAYYAFFSLFPLLLVFVTILGYVLSGNQHEITSITNSVQKNFPSLNHIITFKSLHGHWYVLVIGIATSLYSGLNITNAAQNALDTVWAVPRKARPDWVHQRVRGVGLLFSIGLLFIIAAGASGLVSGGLGGAGAKIGGIVVSLIANVALFFVAFRFMTAKAVPTRDLRSGIVAAAIFWTILQAVGGLYIGHVTKHMSAAYATVSTVLALIIWLHLGARLTLYAVELNTVVERKLYPRSLIGPPTQTADQETLEALAKTEERSPAEHVEVSFETPAEPDPDPGGPPIPHA